VSSYTAPASTGLSQEDVDAAIAAAIAAAASDYEPSDADLAAIAALTTTPAGRSLLAAADAAAIRVIAGAEATGVAAALVDDLSGVSDPLAAQRALGIYAAVATADQTVAASTVLVDDAALQIATVPNGLYAVDAHLVADAAAAGDYKAAWAFSGTATLRWAIRGLNATNVWDSEGWHDLAATRPFAGASALFTSARVAGLLTVTAPGLFKHQFAQQAASGSTIRKAGSWLRLTRVA
jgi:hypothetical protein